MIGELLIPYGLKFETANDVEQAIQKINNQNYSLILTDLNLGGVFRTDEIIEIAKQKKPHQAIALMSGGNAARDPRIKKVLNLHPDIQILLKPFDQMQVVKRFLAE